MLYYIQDGDTLKVIAKRFGTTIDAILKANVICYKNLIFVGQVLIIPKSGLELPKAGAGMYYIVQPGDSLYCIAKQTNTSVSNLVYINQVVHPNLIVIGDEILTITPTVQSPEELKTIWENTPDVDYIVYDYAQHDLYIMSFEWIAFGYKSIPYLLDLLKHPCDIIRFYVILCLGRLAIDTKAIRDALIEALKNPEIADVARFALRRIDSAKTSRKRIHVTLIDYKLLNEPRLDSISTPLLAGCEIIVLRWFIPSPAGEEGPRGGLQIYDQIQDVKSGHIGFLERIGLDEIIFI
jgi:LysM repeat protein